MTAVELHSSRNVTKLVTAVEYRRGDVLRCRIAGGEVWRPSDSAPTPIAPSTTCSFSQIPFSSSLLIPYIRVVYRTATRCLERCFSRKCSKGRSFLHIRVTSIIYVRGYQWKGNTLHKTTFIKSTFVIIYIHIYLYIIYTYIYTWYTYIVYTHTHIIYIYIYIHEQVGIERRGCFIVVNCH